MAEGLINYLLSDEEEAREIRQKFVIKIIPMLNPDGVVMGNSRSSLLGVDLNRRWQKPSKFLHPTIYYSKSLIKYLNKKLHQPEVKSGGVVMFTDIHGHNKNMDIFMYSCTVERDYAYHEGNMIIRSVPDGVDRLIPVFSSQKCRFAIEADKVETGRIVVFREFNILNSYTLECSYHGSEHLQRTKQIYMAIYSQEYLQGVNQRYHISAQRTNIYFDVNTYFQASADFIRGVNWSSKRKPILSNWFRIEPQNIIDQNLNSKPDADTTYEDYLKELESRWRPTGNILDDGKAGMTEKYGGPSLAYIYDGPAPVDDKLEKVEKRKKEKAEREQKRRQQELMLKTYSKMSGSKQRKRDLSNEQKLDKLNADIAEVSQQANSRKNSANKKSPGLSKNKDPSFKRKAKGLNVEGSFGKLSLNPSQNENDQNQDSRAENQQSKYKPNNMKDDWASRPRTKLHGNDDLDHNIASKTPSLEDNSKETDKSLSAKRSGSRALQNMLQTTTYSFQKKLAEELFEVVDQKDRLSSSRKKAIGSKHSTEQHHITMGATKFGYAKDRSDGRQLNFLDQKLQSKNHFKVKVDIPAVDHQTMIQSKISQSGQDKSKFGQSSRNQTLENFAKLSLINQSSHDVNSPLVFQQEGLSASRKHFKRMSFGSSIESESENEDLKLPPIFPQSQSLNSQANLLSVDPLVVSLKQLQQLSKVKLQTIANHRDSSPFKTPNSPKKEIFAPINAVYSQRSLISNSELAEKKDISFFLEQSLDSAFQQRKMTQFQSPAKPLLDQKRGPAVVPNLARQQSNTPGKAIQIKNGFELQPQQYLSPRVKPEPKLSPRFKQNKRPHVILKPLSELDWMQLQPSLKKGSKRIYSDLSEQEQRQTIRVLQRVIGNLEIKRNKLLIGRTQLLPMIEHYTQAKSPQRMMKNASDLYGGSVDQKADEYSWPPQKCIQSPIPVTTSP